MIKLSNEMFLNEIFVGFYKWIQLDLKLEQANLKKLFELLITKDKTFIEHCPETIKKDIVVLESLMNSLSINENERKGILDFIDCCIDLYLYEISNKTNELEADILYYKATISQYYINGTFNILDMNKFIDFKKEFFQIGVQISNFYKSTADERKVISQIIKSKTEELFNRYGFQYYLPICCNF